MATATKQPLIAVQDSDGYWHAMRPMANRMIALCGYLNIERGSAERGDYKSRKDCTGLTCCGCQSLSTEGN